MTFCNGTMYTPRSLALPADVPEASAPACVVLETDIKAHEERGSVEQIPVTRGDIG